MTYMSLTLSPTFTAHINLLGELDRSHRLLPSVLLWPISVEHLINYCTNDLRGLDTNDCLSSLSGLVLQDFSCLFQPLLSLPIDPQRRQGHAGLLGANEMFSLDMASPVDGVDHP